MIRYPVTRATLIRRIDSEKPNWRKRAKVLTDEPFKQGTTELKAGIWSDIKAVYMRLQHNKCGYCERQFESERYGKIEHDMEHFRPKGSVAQWPSTEIEKERDIQVDFFTGDASDSGYLHLWHHPLNFLTSCKTCNTIFKSDFFPIEGPRNTAAKRPTRQNKEQALLVYPLGDFDEDPEDLIHFFGFLAMAKAPFGTRAYRRGLVIIDFFNLNRPTLQFQRAEIIKSMDIAFRLSQVGEASDRNLAMQTIELACSERAAHTACARAYRHLYETDPDEAKKRGQAAFNLLAPD